MYDRTQTDMKRLLLKMSTGTDFGDLLEERVKRYYACHPEEAPANKSQSLFTLKEDMFFGEDEDIVISALTAENGWRPSVREALLTLLAQPHLHEFFEICYMFEGCCQVNVGGKCVFIQQGDMFFYNTHVSHRLDFTGCEGILIIIHVRQTTFTKNLMDTLNSNDLFMNFFLNSIYNTHEAPRYLHFRCLSGDLAEFYLFRMIEEYATRQLLYRKCLSSLFCCLLTELTRARMQALSAETPVNAPTMEEIVSYIGRHYKTVTLLTAAEHFCYSPNHLSKLIYKSTGRTFSQLLNSMKLDKARHLLSISAIPIEEVSSLLGYCERSYFDKYFKKTYGITPFQYRISCNRELDADAQ